MEQSNCVACDEAPGNIVMNGSVLVSKMFQEVTGLRVQPNYTICKSCQQELRSCYNFRKRCNEIFSLYNSSYASQQQRPCQDESKPPEEQLQVFATPLLSSVSFSDANDVTFCKTEAETNVVTFSAENDDDDSFDRHQSDAAEAEDQAKSDEEDEQGSGDDTTHFDQDIKMPESDEEEEEDANKSDLNDPSYERFQCEQCPKSFARRPQLVAHMSTHRRQTIYACPRAGCTSSFHVSHRLIRHLRTVHSANEDEVEETRDSIKALRPAKVTVAVQAPKVPVPEGKVQCSVCLKVLANKRYLKEHEELQHTKRAKYECTHEGCTKRFKIWSLYEMHMKKHNGQQDFVCRFCGKGYVQRKIFNSHLRNSHQVTQDEIDRLRWSVDGSEMRDNRCAECRLEFKTPHKLFEHQALVHGEGRRYICDICGKAFFSKAFLSSHQKYHKGVKNRRCTKCPSAFTEDKGLRTHLRRVHHMTDEEVYALGIVERRS